MRSVDSVTVFDTFSKHATPKIYFAHVYKIIQIVMSHTRIDFDYYLILHVLYLKHNFLPFDTNVTIVIH